MPKPSIKAAIVAATLAVVAVPSPAPAAADCIPSGDLRGDAELIGELVSILGERGLAIGAGGPCGAVAITVERADAGDGLRVTRDPDGPSAESRLAPDVRAAATVIESWLRVDLAAPLLAERAVAGAAIDEAAADVTSASTTTRALSLGASAQIGVGADGSTWSGIQLSGCVNINVICVGAIVRAARDNKTGGDSERLDGDRTAFDTVFTVDVPFRRDRWALTPGVGVGQGAITATLADGEDEDLAGIRLRAHVGVGYRLGSRWLIHFDPEIVFAPGAPRIAEDVEIDEPTRTFPGEPGVHYRLGIGVVLEAL